jgi:hypothetical protein
LENRLHDVSLLKGVGGSARLSGPLDRRVAVAVMVEPVKSRAGERRGCR